MEDNSFAANQSPQQPVRPEVVYARVPPPSPPQRSGCLFRAIFVLVVACLMGSMFINLVLFAVVAVTSAAAGDQENRVQEQHYAMNREGTQKIAIISIEGTILSGEGFFRSQIEHARKDIEAGHLKGIVLRVNSPGGTISGSDYMLHHLRELVAEKKIPIAVSMGGVAASGGYYVSMCVGDTPNTIFAEPSTWTGSIGVVIPHYNLADLMEKWGIQDDAVSSGPLKTMGSFARKMTPKEREIFQQLVNDGFVQFKDVIKSGRPKFKKNPESLDQIATGQVYTSSQALQNGLVDKIGYVEDAVNRVIELGRLNKAAVQVVKYKAEPRLSEILFGQSNIRGGFNLSALLDSTTPRGYFLCTWLPAIVGTAKQD